MSFVLCPLSFVLAHTERPWQNPTSRWDVTGDGSLAPEDLLALINHLNSFGPHLLDQPKGANDFFLDVNGDNAVSWNDYYHVKHKDGGGSGTFASPWQNPANSRDVNNDGVADIADAQALIAYLDGLFGTPTSFPLAGLDGVAIRTHGGDDTVVSTIVNSDFQLRIYAGDDNDLIQTGPTNDIVSGDLGDDTILTSAGNDTIYAGPGNDSLDGGDGQDWLDAGGGSNIVVGGYGDDVLIGTDGDDSIYGGAGNDNLVGGPGNDYLDGGEGNDSLFGEAGNDTLKGHDGNDFIDGGEGNDDADGGAGDDTIGGGGGDDVIYGDSGYDFVYGGLGLDSLYPGGQSGDYSSADGDIPPYVPEIPKVSVIMTGATEGTAPEEIGQITVSISLSRPPMPNEAISISFSIEGITAALGQDFQLPGVTAVNGKYEGTIELTPLNGYDSFYLFTIPDYVTENDETLSITLSNPQGCVIATGHGSATATIQDDDEYGVYAEADGFDENGNFNYWTFDQLVLDVPASDGVLLNDYDYFQYDPEEPPPPLTAHICDEETDEVDGLGCVGPAFGSVTLYSDGGFKYVPSTVGWYGIDSFMYFAQAQDGRQSPPTVVSVARLKPWIKATAPDSFDKIIALGVPPPTAWVGQGITFSVEVTGPPVANPLGANPKFDWRVSGETVAAATDGFTDAFSPTWLHVFPFTGAKTKEANPTVWWISPGLQSVSVTVQIPKRFGLPGTDEISSAGTLRTVRPETTMLARPDQIREFPGVGGTTIFQLGNEYNPALNDSEKKMGMKFEVHPDVNAGGEYQFVQLIDFDRWKYTLDYTYQMRSGGFVLDLHPLSTAYWMARSFEMKDGKEVITAWDSPATIHPNPPDDDLATARTDSFRTWLMWRPAKPNSIFVPLRISTWSFHTYEYWDSATSKWKISGGDWTPKQDTPASVTTVYPQWDTSSLRIPWVDTD